MSTDPITQEIIQNRLISLAQQTTGRLVRASRSFQIKEMEDCSSALFDASGRLLAESANIPIHLGSVGVALKSILADYLSADKWQDGDVIITNDPYLSGSRGSAHTNDIVVYAPIFDGEILVGIAGQMAHHLDIGAMWMGTRGWGVDIFQEGLRLPPMKIVRRGQLDEPLLGLITRNSRVPGTMGNDLRAQIGSVQVCCRDFAALVRTVGRHVVLSTFDALIDQGETRTRAEIAAIPDGEYRHEEPVLDDGAEGGPYWLRVAVRVHGDEITFDFTGTDDQIAGPINSPLSTTLSAMHYVLRCITDPTIPNTEGCKQPVSVIAPEGTLVNAKEPAAVFQRMITCHSLVDLLMGALGQAVPNRVMADSCGCQYNYTIAHDTRTNSPCMFGEVMGGGMGAMSGADGIDVMSCHVTNCASPPIEAMEAEAPVLYLKREFQCDTGGAGEWRGGVGQILSYRVLGTQAKLHRTSQKSVSLPQGTQGGGPGAGGGWIINENDEGEERLKYTIGDVKRLKPGDTVTQRTPGGGGYGDPFHRDPMAIERDLRAGFLSIEAAERDYGVEVDRATLRVTRRDVRRQAS